MNMTTPKMLIEQRNALETKISRIKSSLHGLNLSLQKAGEELAEINEAISKFADLTQKVNAIENPGWTGKGKPPFRLLNPPLK